MPERRCTLSSSCDAAVALVGGAGTLEEVAELWASRKLGWHDKPVILLNHKGFWQGLVQQLHAMVDAGALSADGRDSISVCDDLRATCEVLTSAHRAKGKREHSHGDAVVRESVEVVAEEETTI